MFSKLRVTSSRLPEGDEEILVDRLCDLFDACLAVARLPSGRVIPAASPKDLYPHMTEADWIRLQLFHEMSAIHDRYGVGDPAGLKGRGLSELTSVAAPLLFSDHEFERYLAGAQPGQALPQVQMRARWTGAAAAPPPRIEPGETAASAMTRLHAGPLNRVAYSRGIRDLAIGHREARTYYFLVPYAIGRYRQSEPPPYEALSAPETFAVEKMMKALVAGLDLPDVIANLPIRLQYRAHNLTERLYDFQFAVLQLLSDNDLPEVLPSGPPLADAEVTGLGACEAALHLVTAAIDVAAEGCNEMGRNAAPGADWRSAVFGEQRI